MCQARVVPVVSSDKVFADVEFRFSGSVLMQSM